MKARHTGAGWMFHCPGCKHAHVVGDRWSTNGDPEEPTFSPSILIRGQHYPSGGEWPNDEEDAQLSRGETMRMVPYVCHSFVHLGLIRFLEDCTHELKGQTVALPEL